MTNKHTSLKNIPLTLYSQKVVCERWVGDRTDCNILTPSSSDYSSTSFLFCWAAQLGSLRATSPQSGACSHCLKLQLKLTQAVCGSWLYNCLMPTCFLWALQLHRIQPVLRSRWYPDIFDRMHLLFTLVHLLIDSSVEGQYVTKQHQFAAVNKMAE